MRYVAHMVNGDEFTVDFSPALVGVEDFEWGLSLLSGAVEGTLLNMAHVMKLVPVDGNDES